jgi:catechol 2,3-dioxygenase-like lactoylglutathione lyase family enzyme
VKVVHLMVPASKFAETVEFYAEGLGLEGDTTENDAVEFLIGSQKIELLPIPVPLQRRDTHVSLHVHGLHECVRHLVSTGRIPRSDLERSTDVHGRFEISDPAGNVISLIEAK